MWRKRIFKALGHGREKAAAWANHNPKTMVAGMFTILCAALLWLVAFREKAPDQNFFSSISSIYSQHEKPVAPGPGLTEMAEIYSRLQSLNPDSLKARDSVFLQQIDQQLNSIIHE